MELHFKLELADVHQTMVVNVEITDPFLHALWLLKKDNRHLTGLAIDDLKIYHMGVLVTAKCHQAMHDVIDYQEDKHFYTINVQICGRGGGITRGVQKSHLKKTDAVKQLIKRAITNIKHKYYSHGDASSSTITCPPALTSSVQPILENLEGVKEQVRRNEGVIFPSLHALTDEQLERLTEVFDARSSTEEKLNSAVNIFLEKDIEKIQSSIDNLEFLKFQMWQCLVSSFGHEFNTTRAHSISFDCREFQKNLADTVSYRRGIQRHVQVSNSETADINAPNRCSIM